MRLVLRLPDDLPRRELDAGRTLVVLDGPPERPRATLTLHHPRIVPVSLLEWASDVPRSELPPGAVAGVVSSSVVKNQVGWTMQVVHGVVSRPPDPAPLEVRLTAIFRFQPSQTYAAAAVARVLEPARFEALRPQLLELFQTARPDWNGPEVAGLAQLYD